MKPHSSTLRHAFTLIEILITVVVMSIVAALALPAFTQGAQVNITGVATALASDLEFTQSLSLASPQNPALLKIDPANGTYWIAYATDPDAPIVRPGTTNEPYQIIFGQGQAAAFLGVTLDTSTLVNNSIVFDSYGRLLTNTSVQIGLTTSDGRTRTVTVDSNTGFVTIQ